MNAIYFGKITLILILINVIVFFGIQEMDNNKIYDEKWEKNCLSNKENILCKYTPNTEDIETKEKYVCSKNAIIYKNGEKYYNLTLTKCYKYPENCCVWTETDSYALIGKFALEKPYTFITSMFMHVNINHLLGNMIFLFVLGGIVEMILGIKKFLTIYFLAEIFGGIIMILMVNEGIVDPYVPILGASGAIFGILAAAAILRPNEIIYIYFFPVPLIIIGIIYIALQIYYIAIGGEAGVANGAHLGGAIIGIILGLYWKRKLNATVN